MSNPIALETGLGSLTAVAAHHAQSMTATGCNGKLATELAAAIMALSSNDDGRRACRAIFTAWRNASFTDNGKLFTIDATGEMRDEYISSKSTREAIALMMAD